VAGTKQACFSRSSAAASAGRPVLGIPGRTTTDRPARAASEVLPPQLTSTGSAFVNRDGAARRRPDGYRGHWRVVRLGLSTRILRKAARELQSAAGSATLELADHVLKERIAMIGALPANPGWSSLLGRSADAKNGSWARSCPPRTMMRTCAKARISEHECCGGSGYLPLSVRVYSCVDNALRVSSPADWSFVRVRRQSAGSCRADPQRWDRNSNTTPHDTKSYGYATYRRPDQVG